MMSLTKDGQINKDLRDNRDQRYGKSTSEVKELRRGMQPHGPVAAGADHWEVGSHPAAHTPDVCAAVW